MRPFRRSPMLLAAVVFLALNAEGGKNVTISRGMLPDGTVGVPHSLQGGGGIALVQSASLSGSSVPSISVAFPSGNTKGNLLIAFVRLSTTSQTVTVSDTAGNRYMDAVSQAQDADRHQVHIFYVASAVGGANKITATFSGANNHPFLAIYEYGGSLSLDRTAAAQGFGAAPNSGATLATRSTNELVFGATGLPADYTGTATAGSGFTREAQDVGTSRAVNEDQVVAGTGSFAAAFNLSSSANWTAVVATFSASGTPPPGVLAFNGLPLTANSGQQMPFDLMLSSAATQAISGQVTLSFQPDAMVAADDPAIQFSNGSRTVPFSIPAGATKAVFPVSPTALQTGTVAGTITMAVSSNVAGGNITQKLVVGRAAPAILSVTVTRNSSGFQVQVAGFSNTRDLSAATFHFIAVAGQMLQTSDLSVNLATQASQWYSGNSSAQFGGQFLLVVPFVVSKGAATGLSTVGVQVQNGQSTSSTVTANF